MTLRPINSLEEYTPDLDPTEIIFISSLVKMCNYKTILEFGAYKGTSARAFLAGGATKVYSIDLLPLEAINEYHITIQKDIKDFNSDDIKDTIDLIFFDSHTYFQKQALELLIKDSKVIDTTLLVFHDTNSAFSDKMFSHQVSEKMIVSELYELGFQCISLGSIDGITLCRKFTNNDRALFL